MAFEDYVQRGDSHEQLWRYMDFIKFMSLLERSALFFCQVRRLEDKYEGSFSLISDFYVDLESDMGKSLVNYRNNFKGMMSYLCVNCWHVNEEESAAMWSLYSNRGQGIAIQSTIGKLEEAFRGFPARSFWMGKVNYGQAVITPSAEPFLGENLLFYKRKSFEHEREYRLMITQTSDNNLEPLGGVYVRVDLTSLIERIYIAPNSPGWFSELVKSITESKYNLNVEVIQSDIDRDPLY
jgi:hypothetical protein